MTVRRFVGSVGVHKVMCVGANIYTEIMFMLESFAREKHETITEPKKYACYSQILCNFIK